MKIGILTYHRAENYGGCLQAYALKTYLEQMGHKVQFVDYWPDYHAEHYRYFNRHELNWRNFAGKCAYLLFTFISLPWLIKRKRKFEMFFRNHFQIGSTPVYCINNTVCNRKFDAVIYGSDQIWRKQGFRTFEDYDLWYFGNQNIVCNKKIAYAASMGIIDRTDESSVFLKEILNNFSALSVREQKLKDFIGECGYNGEIVLDPVFLLSKEKWDYLYSKPQSDEKYILFYNLLQTPESVALARKLAQQYQYPIKEITKNRDWRGDNGKTVKSASPEEFLSLIANAEIIVGNSFHGVAFSILLGKEFYAVGMRNKSERVTSLLSKLGIEERYIDGEVLPEGKIDYAAVNSKLENLRSISIKYLADSLI